MPPEHAPHERTLMAWPCRAELYRGAMARAKAEHADVANAVAAFEPVTMVCRDERDAAEARAACTGAVEVIELPIDDSWLRDSGPVFVLHRDGRRAGVHFGFNAWGERFHPHDADQRVGRALVEHVGDPVYTAPLVLEGGSVLIDGGGTLVTTEQCLLHPNRNPELSRDEITVHLHEYLGAEQVVWLQDGLEEDRDTDGHVDLIAAFARDGVLLLQRGLPGTRDFEAMEENRRRAIAHGLEVVSFPPLSHVEVEGEPAVHSYLNLYVANGVVVVPLAGQEADEEALERLGRAFPDREVVGVPAPTVAWGGGGPHCITQQVPARRSGAPGAG